MYGTVEDDNNLSWFLLMYHGTFNIITVKKQFDYILLFWMYYNNIKTNVSLAHHHKSKYRVCYLIRRVLCCRTSDWERRASICGCCWPGSEERIWTVFIITDPLLSVPVNKCRWTSISDITWHRSITHLAVTSQIHCSPSRSPSRTFNSYFQGLASFPLQCFFLYLFRKKLLG